MILITPLPGVTTTEARLGDEAVPRRRRGGRRRAGRTRSSPGGGGYLVLERPWPAMLRGIYGDDERYRETYWSRFPGVYFAGDGARIDEDGDFWLLGRVDDVMNVSGHRISTIEVERALVDHPKVAEAAVCGRADATTGQAIVAYVTLKGGRRGLGRDARGAAQPRREEDRRDREAREHRLHARAAEDALAARSCAACSATSPSTARSATRRRSPTPPSCRRSPSARRDAGRRRVAPSGVRREVGHPRRRRPRERRDSAVDVRLGRPPARRPRADRSASVPHRRAHPRLALACTAASDGPRLLVVREAKEHLVEHDVVQHLAARQPGDPFREAACVGARALDEVGDPGAAELPGSQPRPARSGRAARTPGCSPWGRGSPRAPRRRGRARRTPSRPRGRPGARRSRCRSRTGRSAICVRPSPRNRRARSRRGDA